MLFHYCSLLSDRESEQEIEQLAASLERDEIRIAEQQIPTK